jgi:hypothetical protein
MRRKQDKNSANHAYDVKKRVIGQFSHILAANAVPMSNVCQVIERKVQTGTLYSAMTSPC